VATLVVVVAGKSPALRNPLNHACQMMYMCATDLAVAFPPLIISASAVLQLRLLRWRRQPVSGMMHSFESTQIPGFLPP